MTASTDTYYEVFSCLRSKPECLKAREVCLGRCGGESVEVRQDFATMISKREMSDTVLSQNYGWERSRANCSVKTTVIDVPLFEGGDSLRAWVAGVRTRSGFTAIDPRVCTLYPEACGAIQRVLERAPTLVYVNGQFKHAYELTPPSPPSPPSPPPRTLSYREVEPPPPSPPPLMPPPYYTGAGDCLPMITAIQAGFDVNDPTLPVDEHRSVCVYVRRILDERRPAFDCFHTAPPSPPPPPPTSEDQLNEQQASLRYKRIQTGDTERYAEPEVGQAERLEDGQTNERSAIYQTIKALTDDQPQLRDLLLSTAEKIEARLPGATAQVPAVAGGRRLSETYQQRFGEPQANGRRLFRVDYETENTIRESLVESAVMSTFDGGPIPGITVAECAALCEALRRNESETREDSTTECKAYAFRRLDPADLTDLTVDCYLLHSSGACKVTDFAASIYTRRYDSNICNHPTVHNSPLCIELPASREDAKVLDYAAAHDLCAQVPDKTLGGAGKLPLPRSALEAMSFMSYARQQGVYSFWAQKPTHLFDTTHGSSVPITMRWAGETGKDFVYPANDTRCVLIETEEGSKSNHMYATMQPCAAKKSDGVVCEAVSAGETPVTFIEHTAQTLSH